MLSMYKAGLDNQEGQETQTTVSVKSHFGGENVLLLWTAFAQPFTDGQTIIDHRNEYDYRQIIS